MNTNANTEAGQAPSLVLPGVDTPETSRPFPAKASAGGLAKRWRKRAFAILAVIPVTMAMGLSYRFIQSRADANRFPQEGRSVDIGGFSLNINCTGQGSPTVILEAGLGVPAISWQLSSGISPNSRAYVPMTVPGTTGAIPVPCRGQPRKA